jgi:hypothetical protein
MSRIRLSAILFLSALFCAFTFSDAPEISAAKGKKGSKLFNGKDLTGWKIHGTEKWYVEKGELICESGPDKKYGYLATEKHYKDFDLTLQFRQESAGNSGVFFRANINGTSIKGWQVEVAPPNHDSGGIYESGWGRGWLAKIPDERENILKYGEWNKLRVRVVGGKATTWLNGEQMVDIDNENIAAANGSIALQIHDGGGIKVRWKDLRIKEL